jgi:hypothetical protein
LKQKRVRLIGVRVGRFESAGAEVTD